MPLSPSSYVRFAVAGRADCVDAAHPIWREPLPLAATPPLDTSGSAGGVSHGDYFDAVHNYLRSAGTAHLDAALAEGASPPPFISAVDVILEKHGEFYHPARIRIATPQRRQTFVLNVAVTPAGIECMQNEIDALGQVGPRLPKGSLPRVFGTSHVDTQTESGFGMFLAEWFENYHEFHLAVDPDDGRLKMVVWDTSRTPYFLGSDAMATVYAQTAFLLARAYDPATTRQIYPWHHAAGDFVLRTCNGTVNVKLITARQYAPTLETGTGKAPDAETRLMAAVVFFANLTLRNRIDRLNGTGELVWADDTVVAATVDGFKRGLDGPLHADLTPLLLSYGFDDWQTLLTAVGTRYRLMPAEEDLWADRIADHAARLESVICQEFGG